MLVALGSSGTFSFKKDIHSLAVNKGESANFSLLVRICGSATLPEYETL